MRRSCSSHSFPPCHNDHVACKDVGSCAAKDDHECKESRAPTTLRSISEPCCHKNYLTAFRAVDAFTQAPNFIHALASKWISSRPDTFHRQRSSPPEGTSSNEGSTLKADFLIFVVSLSRQSIDHRPRSSRLAAKGTFPGTRPTGDISRRSLTSSRAPRHFLRPTRVSHSPSQKGCYPWSRPTLVFQVQRPFTL